MQLRGYFSHEIKQRFYVIIKTLEGFDNELKDRDIELKKIIKCPLRLEKKKQSAGIDFCVQLSLISNKTLLCPPMKTNYTMHRGEFTATWNQVLVFPIRISELPKTTKLSINVVDIVFPMRKKVIASGRFSIFKGGVIMKTGSGTVEMVSNYCEKNKMLELDFELPNFKSHVIYGSPKRGINFKTNYFADGEEELNQVHTPKAVLFEMNQAEFGYKISFPYGGVREVLRLPQSYENPFLFSEDPILTSGDYFSPSVKKEYALQLGSVDEHYTPKTENAELKKISENIGKKSCLEQITMSEKLLLWKHRRKLKNDPSYQVKLLECVDWKNARVKKEAIKIIESWTSLPLYNILELLSYKFKGEHIVRDSTIRFLEKEKEKKILEISMQLVQSLIYETRETKDSPLAQFLFSHSKKSFKFATQVYWHMKCDPRFKKHSEELMDFIKEERSIYDGINRQVKLMDIFSDIHNNINSHQKEFVIKLFKKNSKKFKKVFPLYLPIDPDIYATGIDYNKISVFKSGSFPLKIPFIQKDKKIYYAIYKEGDDLRQDQLIVNMLKILSRLLVENSVKERIELLTPYKVVSTGIKKGLIELVHPSTSLQNVLKEGVNKEKKSDLIRGWLSLRNTTISEYNNSVNMFVKTMAVYTMISYVLGLGDRHLDNILIQDSGKIFHVDFGYILGARQFFEIHKPQIKLNSEMIEGLGGIKSIDYENFLRECCSSYKITRKNSKIFLSMFLMMVDSGMKDIQQFDQQHGENQENRSINKIFLVQDRLKIHSSEETAQIYLIKKIIENTSTFGGKIEDFTHQVSIIIKTKFT